MTWVRIEPDFPDHPKVVAVGPEAAWLYVRALCYSNRFHTDGIVPRSVVKTWGARDTLTMRLVDIGLWHEHARGYRIHDFHEYQPTAAEVAELRAKRQASGQAGGQASASARAQRSPQANGQAKSKPGSVPVPRSTSTEAKASSEVRRPRDELWDAFTTELGEPLTASERGRRNKAVKEIRDAGGTGAEVRAACAAQRRDWPEMELTATSIAANWSRFKDGQSAELTAAELYVRDRKQREEAQT